MCSGKDLWCFALLFVFVCISGIYALGISEICLVGCSCASPVCFSLFVSGKGVSQFIRRSVVALALCLARATNIVPDRRLSSDDVSSEIQMYCLFDLF